MSMQLFLCIFLLQDHSLLRPEILIQLQRDVMTSLSRPKRIECKNKQRIHNSSPQNELNHHTPGRRRRRSCRTRGRLVLEWERR